MLSAIVPRRPLPILLLAGTLLVLQTAGAWCADAKPMQAGKADAQAAFAKQAASVPPASGPGPRIAGCYIWSGRADETYKPFFQWELRLAGGTASETGLSIRVVTLGTDRKPLVSGPWKVLGTIASGASRDIDYKLNCPNFPAYQVEFTWKDSKDAALGWDKVSLPVMLSELSGTSFLVSLNQNADYSDSAHTAAVSWTLWNIGAQPAHDVVQTVRFLDDKGKEVAKADYKPEKGEIAAGLNKEEKFTARKIPAFSVISVATKLTDAGTLSSLDQGSFTGAKDVEIAKVHVDGKQLKARVRNGTGAALSAVVVSITLQSRDGKPVKHYDLTVGKLAADEERDVSADLTGVGSWSGYEVAWRNDAGAATAAAP